MPPSLLAHLFHGAEVDDASVVDQYVEAAVARLQVALGRLPISRLGDVQHLCIEAGDRVALAFVQDASHHLRTFFGEPGCRRQTDA